MSGHHVVEPPPRLKRTHLENFALVPGSLLPYKEEWQTIANTLPIGTVLVVLPARNHPQRQLYERVTSLLQATGYTVRIISEGELEDYRRRRPVQGRLI